MPRRDSYLTDDEDDDRRAAASGGTPGWVWVAVGGGVLAALVVVGLGLFAFSRREAARHEVARADLMRAEAQARHAETMAADAGPGGAAGAAGMGGPGGRPPLVSLTRITNAYKADRAKAEARYANQQVRVRVEVTVTGVRANGEAWVGASADLGGGAPPGTEPNVVFRLIEGPVAAGATVVLEGRCDGLLPDPRGGETLTFADCRVERE